MAEPLKNQFGEDLPSRIAAMISAVHDRFDSKSFVQDSLKGYADLGLTDRARNISRSLHTHLPPDYRDAISIIIQSLGPKLDDVEIKGMAPFMYLPHAYFIGAYGLNEFELSMHAQYEITQRFTAEFSIRPFLMHHTEATLARLRDWTADPSPHVRRLVSEGTRPRLPWAPRLNHFQDDPTPVLELLELLKDDPELYVRRSVANNLNDIGKDNPEALFTTARRWMKGADTERSWIVKHSLRSAIKRGEAGALAILGADKPVQADISDVCITPSQPRIGDSVTISFDLLSTAGVPQRVLIDCAVHFVKANGLTTPKVFKLKTVDLNAKNTIKLKKTISLGNLTTRKHYPGTHSVELILNGRSLPLGSFELRP